MTQEELVNNLYWYRASTVRVVDGDTADLLLDLGYKIRFEQRVRLYGLNAPEVHGATKEAGLKTKGRLAELIVGKELWVDSIKDSQEKYGRYLVEIWVKSDTGLKSVNQLLIKEGLAEARSY